jgi:hypothetical protein
MMRCLDEESEGVVIALAIFCSGRTGRAIATLFSIVQFPRPEHVVPLRHTTFRVW